MFDYLNILLVLHSRKETEEVWELLASIGRLKHKCTTWYIYIKQIGRNKKLNAADLISKK